MSQSSTVTQKPQAGDLVHVQVEFAPHGPRKGYTVDYYGRVAAVVENSVILTYLGVRLVVPLGNNVTVTVLQEA